MTQLWAGLANGRPEVFHPEKVLNTSLLCCCLDRRKYIVRCSKLWGFVDCSNIKMKMKQRILGCLKKGIKVFDD